MKKTILIALSIIILSFTFKLPTEREYIIRIPESKINTYWSIVHGQGDELKVKDYKEILPIIEQQVLSQANQFHIADSIAAKKDTTKIKK